MIPQPNHVRLLYTKDNIGLSRVTAELLLQASLRMKPDRILLQELRDDAAWTYINEVVVRPPGLHHDHSWPRIPSRRSSGCSRSSRAARKAGSGTIRPLIGFLSSAVDVIIPFHNEGTLYEIGEVWFAADAAAAR